MIKNTKSVEDTFMSKATVENAVNQVQMKQVMIELTPGRYILKAIMSGFLLAIVTVFMFAMKTLFAGTNDGLIGLVGAISFSLALVLIVLTHSELLTSNFMYLTIGWYYKVITLNKIVVIAMVCFAFNIVGGFILFGLMKFTQIMTPEMITALSDMVQLKTVDSSWYEIL
ncbi:formate/nitrite transporter family protein, partial [Staphylococcus arlettae]